MTRAFFVSLTNGYDPHISPLGRRIVLVTGVGLVA